MPTLSHPWQVCTMDIFTLEGIDYLICGNFYSKMILIQHLPSGQSNTIKVVSLLKEMFLEDGIPEVLCSDNCPQYASAQFTEFCTSWGITHETSSPHYLQSNGFAEAFIKSVKHALKHAKYSGANPQLILLALWATPINAKLPSSAELLYQHQIRTTIPARICNTDPAALQIHECIDAGSNASKSQADKWCKSLAPLYASQPIAMYDTILKSWIPTTVVHVLLKDGYQVHTSNGVVYCCMRWHLHKHNVKPTDTASDITTATLHAAPADLAFLCHCLHLPSLHNCHSLCPLHLQCLQLQNQTPAVPKVAPGPMPVTPSVAPVQPQRSGHACTTPKCLIQKL